MQHDNSDDPYGFWKAEPTRQLKRTQVAVRSHNETRMVPVVRMDRTRQIPELRPRNPLVTRMAVMGGVTLLLIPLALSLRDDRSQVRAAEIQGVDTVKVGKLPLPAPTQATIAPATDAPIDDRPHVRRSSDSRADRGRRRCHPGADRASHDGREEGSSEIDHDGGAGFVRRSISR